MRNLAKSMMAAAIAAIGFGGFAGATTVNQAVSDILHGTYGDHPTPLVAYTGAIVVKYTNYDVGRIYTAPTGTYGRAVPANAGESDATAIAQMNAVASTAKPGSSFAANEDSWGILRVSEIDNASQTRILWSRLTAPYEMTGMFFGEQDTYLEVIGGTTQHIHGVDFSTALYIDDSKNFDPTGGPSVRSGLASYPTVTDGSLFWTFNGLAGSADTSFPLDEFLTTFNPAAGPGSPNVGDGKVDATFGTNAAGTGGANAFFDAATGADASIKFTGNSPSIGSGVEGWLVQSNDPLVTTTSVPSPSAAASGLLMLAGLAAWRVRRQQRSE